MEADIVHTHREPVQHLAKNALLAKEETIFKLSADLAEGEEDNSVKIEDSEEFEDHTEGLTEDHTLTGAEEPGVAGIQDKEETIIVVMGIKINKVRSEQ